MQDKRKSRLPVSHATGRQGRRASPPDPTLNPDDEANKLTEKLDLRCTKEEKIAIKEKAAASSISASELLREALGLTDAKRRKPIPTVPPDITRLVATTTRDIQSLASEAREQMGSSFKCQFEVVNVIAALLTLDRRLNALLVHLEGGRP